MVPINQTAVSVQLADVLGTLTSDVRRHLRILVDELGAALDRSRRSRGAEHVLPLLSGCVPLHLAGQRGAARAPPRGPRRCDPKRRPRRVGADPKRGPARGSGHQPARRDGLVRLRGRGARAGHRRAAADAARRAAGVREPQRRVPQPPLLRARGAARGPEPRAHRDSGDAVRATAAPPRVAAGARRPRERPAPDRSPARSPVALRRRLPRAGSRARELPRQRGHPVVQRRGRRGGRVSPSRGRPGLPGDRLRPRGARRGEPLGRRQRPDDPPRGGQRNERRRQRSGGRRGSVLRAHAAAAARGHALDRVVGEDAVPPRAAVREPGSARPARGRRRAPRHRRRRGRRRRPDPGDGA